MKKGMKKLISVLVAAVMCLAMLAGCGANGPDSGGGGSSSAEGDTGKETLTIGFSFRSLDEAMTGWWDTTEQLIAEYNNDPDNPYTIEYYFTNANLEVDTQISDVDSLIVRQPDVICIQSVDTEGSEPAFQACADAGIPVIDFGFGTTFEDYTASLITIDHYGSGVLQAQWLENYLEEHPDEELNIVYINGSQGVQQMEERYQGFMTLFDSEYADRCKLLDTTYANFSADTAQATMEDWIQTYPEVNCVISANDEMCIGALQACIAANKQVIALGMDGNDVGKEAILNDGYSGTIGFDFGKIADAGLDLAINVASGGSFDKQTDISGEVTIVLDASNINEYYTPGIE